MKQKESPWGNMFGGLALAVISFTVWALFMRDIQYGFLAFGPVFFGVVMFFRSLVILFVGEEIEIRDGKFILSRSDEVEYELTLESISEDNWYYESSRQGSTGPSAGQIVNAGSDGLQFGKPGDMIVLDNYNSEEIFQEFKRYGVKLPMYAIFLSGYNYLQLIFDKTTPLKIFDKPEDKGGIEGPELIVDLEKNLIQKTDGSMVKLELNKTLAKPADSIEWADALKHGLKVDDLLFYIDTLCLDKV